MSRNDRRAEYGERPSVQPRRLPAVTTPARDRAERGERHSELGMVGSDVALLVSECGAGVPFAGGQVIPGERDRREVAVDDRDLVVVTEVLHEDMAGGVQQLAARPRRPRLWLRAMRGWATSAAITRAVDDTAVARARRRLAGSGSSWVRAGRWWFACVDHPDRAGPGHESGVPFRGARSESPN